MVCLYRLVVLKTPFSSPGDICRVPWRFLWMLTSWSSNCRNLVPRRFLGRKALRATLGKVAKQLTFFLWFNGHPTKSQIVFKNNWGCYSLLVDL